MIPNTEPGRLCPPEAGCCRAVARAVCPSLTIVEPGSHPPNSSISFHLVNSPMRVLALLSGFYFVINTSKTNSGVDIHCDGPTYARQCYLSIMAHQAHDDAANLQIALADENRFHQLISGL